MKVFLLVCLLVAGSQASFFDDLKASLSGVGHALTDTLHQVGEQAKVVGGQLLETAKQQGTQLASQALQSLLLGTMNALSKPSDPAPAKRDVNTLLGEFGLLQHTAESFLHDKTDALHHTFTAALDKLNQLAHSKPADLVQQVNNVVQNHHTLAETLKTDLLTGLSNMFHQAFQSDNARRSLFTDKLQETLHNLDVNFKAVFGHHLTQVEELVHQLGQLVVSHSLQTPEN